MRGARYFLIFALAIAGLMIFARLGELPLRDPDEGRNTEIAREMGISGAWLTPTYDGLAYLDKPAFFYKAVSLSMRAFGESEAGARIPSALFASAILAMIFGFCRREYDKNTAALALIIVSTAPLFFALARHVIFDMTLTAFVCGAIFAGYYAEANEGRRRRNWYLLGAASAGFATLVKGPVGFLVPILVLSIFNIVDKKTGWWKRLFHPLNFVVFFAITLPWFFGLSRLHPDFPHYGLIEESFNRYTKPKFNRGAPFYYYALIILGGLFAWSLVLPDAIRTAWKQRATWTRADRFLIVWALAVTIFFSLSKSKLPHYILSAIIALGILSARLFARALLNKEGPAARAIFRGLIFLAIASAATAAFLLVNVLIPDAPQRIFHIRSKEFARVSLTFLPGACLLVFVMLAAVASRWLRDLRAAFATFMIMPVAFLTIGFGSIERYMEASSSRKLANSLPKLDSATRVVCFRSFSTGLQFHLKRPLTLISDTGSEFTSNYIVYSLRNKERWPEQVVKYSEMDKWLAEQPEPVYMVCNDLYKSDFEQIAVRYQTPITALSAGWWGALLPPLKK